MSWKDKIGGLGARTGIIRDNYRICPGLYALGQPDQDSPVLVTCNYKLTFDILRKQLGGGSFWILVVETYGINVWCAAGKKSFNTQEVARQVHKSLLDKIVKHRTLIIPQLAAPSVAAHKLKKMCGFKGVFGPLRIEDLPEFINKGMQAGPGMREVVFPLNQRLEVALVEVYGARKFLFWAFVVCLILAALGPGGFSFSGVLLSGLSAFTVVMIGFLTGTFIVPALLPWIPFRSFAAKGIAAGMSVGAILTLVLAGSLAEGFAAMAGSAAFASWFAMHYTGSTPFTSLSGVDQEMRLFMPVQGVMLGLAVLAWMGEAWFRLIVG